ncbi:hypothetical protein F4802DRAFT_565879 [Xylaria palmicola]|nr:hypothetical protein F4802DRAFT_565879 [Xylaria palmicola]
MSTIGMLPLLKSRDAVKQTVKEITNKFVREENDALATIHPALHLPKTELSLVRRNTVNRAEPDAPPQESDALQANRSDATLKKQQGGGENRQTYLSTIEETGKAETAFKDALRNYESTAKEKYKTGVDPDSDHTISQLTEIIDCAIDTYEKEDTEGCWGKIRLAFRNFGENGKAFEGWLGLLPTESPYLSVVCGGLKLIIKVSSVLAHPISCFNLFSEPMQAASRMRNVAKQVLDGLHRIPDILNGARRVLQIFGHDDSLLNQSRKLYTSVLTALGHMLEYFKTKGVRKSAQEIIKATFQQDSFASGLEQKIKDVESERDRFNEEAEYCHKETVNEHQRLERANATIFQQQTETLSTTLIISAREIKRAQEATQSVVIYLEGRMKGLENLLLQLFQDNPKAVEAAYASNKQLDYFPRNTQQFNLQRRSSIIDVARGSKQYPPFSETRRFLLSSLDYDPSIAGDDVANNYTIGASLSPEEQKRSVYVMKSQVFQDWTRNKSSTALIIEGQANKRTTRKSGLSLICARLIYALDQLRSPDPPEKQDPNILTLHFFCGAHDTYTESWESPTGIINSLLAQLLTQCKHLNIQRFPPLSKNHSGSLHNIFSWFKKVLRHLPARATVFCVLDAVSVYFDRHEEDAKWLIQSLLRLSQKRSSKHASIKILLTVPYWLRMSSSELGEVERLSIPKNLAGITGGFTGMRWDMAVGESLAG